ncbi:MAG: nicotinate (nicotinamide) nucleotide adenylyltransferase [Anaerolineaceae bacterium]|nr:nicotinate (nicotinamide) nucleotide adenylyltransferase [Anaerolineaceae bacterium]
MRIGIFGGTFDPPHLGHLILASEALEQLQLDKLLWMVTAIPPHKAINEVHNLEQRLSLTKMAIRDVPQFELSTLEIDRPGPHYSVDTVDIVKEMYPDAEIFFLMGQDSLRDLPLWYKSELFLELCDGLGVMRRPGIETIVTSLFEQYQDIEKKIHWFKTPLVDISSSDIRERIQEGRTYRFFLPDAEFDLIEEKKYYQ